MNKLKVIFFATGLAMTMGGCVGNGSNPVRQDAPAATPVATAECVFPDSPRHAAPLWVCDAPVEGVAVSAVGTYEKSAAGAAFMKDQAAALARVALAQQLRVKVNNMVKQYAETTGGVGSETVDKVNSSVSKLITSETISGSRIFRSVTSPGGSIYVLIGMDPSLTKESAKEVLKTSMGHDQALWQQFKAKKGQDELAEEIAKMNVVK
jgi:hypothetical protein